MTDAAIASPSLTGQRLRISDLHVRFGKNNVIEGLNLDVEAGEFVVLLGPSGCGKSTLLHAMAGLLDVAGGSVEIGGHDMTWADPAKRGIGMVFQSYALYPTMSVEGNLSFGLKVSGLPAEEIRQRVQRAAQILQLETLLQRKPAQLSGGQRQRVAIGRALVRQAGVFLFDEPLSNLDAQLRTDLRREIKRLHHALGSTMVYVTHDQVEAMTLATRLVVMRNGRILQIGTPAEVYERPADRFVAGFVGAPGMNFIEGSVNRQDGAWRFESPSLSLNLTTDIAVEPGHRVTLGLRPEHLQWQADGPWQGKVELVEPLGNHQVVWLTLGGLSLAAVRHDAPAPAMGQSLSFTVRADAASLFDADTGQRL
jgi:multiple sugar transport system ATP-binding protein